MKSNLQSRVEQQSRGRHQRVDGDLSRVQFQIGIQNLSANLGNEGNQIWTLKSPYSLNLDLSSHWVYNVENGPFVTILKP